MTDLCDFTARHFDLRLCVKTVHFKRGMQPTERTGWLKGDDGFLVVDTNNNGRIDDIGEMFGNRLQGGYAELAGYDSNGDGKISVADLMWSELKIWRDYDQDGITDAGDPITGKGKELFTLAQLGIVELSLTNPALNVTTPTGTQLLSSGDVKFAGGRITKMFEAIFQSSDVDTRSNDEARVAPWADSTLNVKGFDSITDLSAAMANGIELGTLATTQVAAMTSPNLKPLRAQEEEVANDNIRLEFQTEIVA